jgi:predicted aspartyl protease
MMQSCSGADASGDAAMGLASGTDLRGVPRRAHWLAGLLLYLLSTPPLMAACQIVQIAELHVRFDGNRPLLDGQINGQDIRILVDTGSSFSFLREDAAAALDLRMSAVPRVDVYGVGGEALMRSVVVKYITIGPFTDKNMELAVVTGHANPRAHEAELVLGQDFFAHFATDFDLGHGAIRLLRPKGCQPDQLAYWSNQYLLAELSGPKYGQPKIQTVVLLNGKRVDAILDTGATTSVISRSVAKEAGVDPSRDAGKPAGLLVGIAGSPIDYWTGTFDTFALGDEIVHNVKLRIADLFESDTQSPTGSRLSRPVEGLVEMMIGADFFRSHRILVLPNERKLVFTYNGGPIFQIIESPAPAGSNADPGPPQSPAN